MTAREAVERFVRDGDTVYSGFNIISFSLTNEIIRQGKRRLKAVAGSVVPNATLMAVAGCVDRIESGYLGGALRSRPFREMMADGRIRWNDYTNMTITLRLMAGGMGMPFICANSFLGTDYLQPEVMNHSRSLAEDRRREDGSIMPPYVVIDSPFDGRKALLYPALKPDVAIVHCQRADEDGNVQIWGPMADTKWGLWASKHVLVTAEEIVPRSVITTEPHFTVIPGFRVSAVIHEPWGAHPGALNGHYKLDRSWNELTGFGMTDRESARQYLDEWVYGTVDRTGYIEQYKERFGADLLESLRVTDRMVPERPARYGWR